MPPFFTAWSMRKTLKALVLCAIGPALAMILAHGVAEYQRISQDVRDQSLSLARVLAHEQGQLALHTRLLLDTLARLPAVRAHDHESLEPLFAALLRDHPVYGNVFLLDSRGLITAAPFPGMRGRDMSDRKYFQDVLRSWSFSAGEFAVSRSTGEPAFHFASPVLDQAGNLAGVLGVAVRLDSLDAALDSPAFPKNMRLALLDHKGVRLHRFPSFHEERLRPGTQSPASIGGVMLASDQDFGQFDGQGSDGVPVSFGFARLRLAPGEAPFLVVSVSIPRPTLAGLLLAGPGLALILLLIAMALALVIVRLLGERTLGAGVDRLVEAAEGLASGDMSGRVGQVEARLEVAELGRVFDRMADQLQAREGLRAATEAELRTSEEQYRRVVETSLEGIWILDENHRATYVNQVLARTLGYAPEDLLGRPMADFIFPEDQAAHKERVLARQQGLDEVYERRLRTATGGDIWVLVSARAVLDGEGHFRGSFAMLTDISEKKARLDQLELLTRAVENALNGYSIVDQEGRFVYVNRAYLSMWGFGSAVEVLGAPLAEHCQDPGLADRIMAEATQIIRGRLEGMLAD